MKAINETIANAIVENIEGNNGTGTWVTTYVSVCIDGIEAYDEDGNEVDVDCDLTEIERSVERLAA